MSERMIELHRAKMGLPPLIQPKSSIMNGTMLSTNAGGNHHNSNNPHSMYHNGPAAANVPTLAPTATVHQHAAVATVMSEDEMLQKFLHLISTSSFDDTASTEINTTTNNNNNSYRRTTPTVPLALSRRLLHRQGAGFLDETVAAIVSGAADRFLATVLQQAIACRDRRLKGEDLINAANRNQRQELALFRKRRRKEMKVRRRKKRKILEQRKQSAISIIKNHEDQQQKLQQQLSQQGKKGSSASSKTKSSKSKKTKANSTNKATNNMAAEIPHASLTANIHNGNLSPISGEINDANKKTTLSEDEDDYDSLDEEAEYYEKFYIDENKNEQDNSDNENGTNNGKDANAKSTGETMDAKGDLKDNDSNEDDDDDSDDDDDDDDSVDDDDDDLQEDEDESRYMLLLRDLTRPLKAWGIDLTGKVGLGAFPPVLTKSANNDADPAKDEEDLEEKDIMDTSPDDDMVDPTAGDGEDAENTNTGNDSVTHSPDGTSTTKKSPPKSNTSKDETSTKATANKNNPNGDQMKSEPAAKRALSITKASVNNSTAGGNSINSANSSTLKGNVTSNSTTQI